MFNSNDYINTRVDKRDFDAGGLLQDAEDGLGHRRSASESTVSRISADDDRRGDGLLNEVVENIVKRDRRKLKMEVVRIFSFIWGVISWYVCLDICRYSVVRLTR